MRHNIHKLLHEGLCTCSPARLDFARKAFRMLPPIDKPRILDIGCGRGDPTLELARLTDGEVTGLDVDQASLDALSVRAAEQGLSDRVHLVNCPMQEMTFGDGSFDIIWAEASIHIVGFEVGLTAWRRLLVPEGFLVVHEMAWLRSHPPVEIADHWRRIYAGIRTVPEYADCIGLCGFRLIDAFALPDDFWWREYYHPLEQRIHALRESCQGDEGSLRALAQEEEQVVLYKKYPHWYGSAYLVMQRRAGRPR
jgi:serine/threonine-protein kinase HipA